jgi:hypothetical protein
MAEWLRPRLWKVVTIKLRGIEPGQILFTKPNTREGYAFCNCGWHRPHLIFKEGVRMAEWLWPGLWEVLTITLRGINPGHILIKMKPTGEGWC